MTKGGERGRPENFQGTEGKRKKKGREKTWPKNHPDSKQRGVLDKNEGKGTLRKKDSSRRGRKGKEPCLGSSGRRRKKGPKKEKKQAS